VAYQTELLHIQPRDKVLEIGTGSVYQASVLAEMGAQVFTIERQKKLYEKNLISYPLKLKYKNIKFFYGDGYKGLPTYAPFDKILITAAAPVIPNDLIAQLKPNGVLVLPLGSDDKQTMTRITKNVDGSLSEEKFEDFVFVPMLKGKAEN
jgi:protein-L-isoaspartate(D-aspartate) O-methyltransferase